jgi:hypothetical protein
MNGNVARFASGKVGTTEIKNTFRYNKYVKEVSSRKKVDVALIFVIPKQSAQNCSSFLTGAQDIHLQRVTIPEAAYI